MWFLSTYDSPISKEKRYNVFILLYESTRILKALKQEYHRANKNSDLRQEIAKLLIDNLHVRINILRHAIKIPIYLFKTHAAQEIKSIKCEIKNYRDRNYRLHNYRSSQNKIPSLTALSLEAFFSRKNPQVREKLNEFCIGNIVDDLSYMPVQRRDQQYK